MKSPLPPREGISANRLRAPGGRETHSGQHLPVPATVGEWIAEVFADFSAAELAYLFADGQLSTAAGARVTPADRLIPGGFYFFHRPVPPEEPIPFDYTVIYQDEHLLVVDKPHFLASTPNGRFVRECVVTRARLDFNEPDLVAIHRLDRVTAGLLVLSRNPETRGAYQRLFQDRKVTKTYRALAALPPDFDPVRFPAQRRTRLEKPTGERAVREVPGPPNSHSTIAFAGYRSAGGDSRGAQADAALTQPGAADPGGQRLGEFILHPLTGKTHQLRVHMLGLGLPILGDPVYPVDLAPDPYDFSSPLQLLASELEFTDPLTGNLHLFKSLRTLKL